jgi:hypothetical protein
VRASSHVKLTAMLVAYVSGHGFGHATWLCEVLAAAVRARAPSLPITSVGTVPERLVKRAVSPPLTPLP